MVVWISVLKPDVTMVMLPLKATEQRKSLRIHSPYYPCNVPNKQFNFTCDVIADSKQVLVYIFVSVVVLSVFLSFLTSYRKNDWYLLDTVNSSVKVISGWVLRMVVVVCTSWSENSTKRSLLFTQFVVVSTFHTSRGDIYSQWEFVKKWLSPKWLPCKQTCQNSLNFLLVCCHTT